MVPIWTLLLRNLLTIGIFFLQCLEEQNCGFDNCTFLIKSEPFICSIVHSFSFSNDGNGTDFRKIGKRHGNTTWMGWSASPSPRTMHTHIHSWGWFRIVHCLPVFRRWEETEESRRIPCKNRDNMGNFGETATLSLQVLGFWCCKVATQCT